MNRERRREGKKKYEGLAHRSSFKVQLVPEYYHTLWTDLNRERFSPLLKLLSSLPPLFSFLFLFLTAETEDEKIPTEVELRILKGENEKNSS